MTVSILENQEKLLAQLNSSIGDKDITIKYFHGVEAISELFEFSVVFLSKNDSIDLEKALGSSINVTFKSESQNRHINGIISAISQGATENKNDIYLTEYTVTIKPKLWLLTLDRNYIIFQNQSAIEIIKRVLKDKGITDVEDKTKTCGKVKRDYCVQYGESSFNFISRLMEEEGIFYFFKHSSNSHTLVLADSSSVHEKTANNSKVEFIKGVNKVLPIGKVFNTSMKTSVNSGSYSIADYNYTISQTELHSKLNSKWKGQEYYEFPGNYEKLKEGDDLAKLRVELFEFNHCLCEASSTVANFSPGFSFELTEHHSKKFNKEYVVYSIEHFYDVSAVQDYIYRNNFKAFLKGQEFRPLRKTVQPRIYGTQTAIVVCPSGEEIYRNEHCCIKVHFHWDRTEKNKEDSSCWIRVAQVMAGSAWGAVFIPRVGQEVVVSFIDGNPDRPIIVGCVYNDKFMPPYSDKESMISCIKSATFKDDDHKMFNEVRFNDEKDKQEIYIHAEKDMYVNVLNSRKTEIEESDDTLDIFKGNRTITLKAEGDDPADHSLLLTKGDSIVELTEGNHVYTIKKGNEEITLSEGNRSVTLKKGDSDITIKDGNQTVTLSKGNLSYDVKGNISIKASGNLNIKVDGNIDMESGKVFTIKAKQDVKVESGTKMNIKSSTDLNVQAGMNYKAKAKMNMALEGGMNFEAKGSLQTKISGMTLEAKGSVQTKVSGTIVEISGNGMTKVSAPMITIGGGMLQLG